MSAVAERTIPDAEGDALARDMEALERPRGLTARELAWAVQEGQRSAWQLEDKLARLYAGRIAKAYRRAARALPRIAKHSSAGGLAAALDPAERAQRQLETTRRTQRAAGRANSRRPGSGGWSMPDHDELGVALKERMDEEWDKKQAGDTPQAIRVEAMRRATSAGLELMHVSFDVRNPLVEGVLGQLGTKITEIEATTRRDIMSSLDASWQAGDSIPRAAKKLRATSEQISLSRGRLIARTEILGAVNGGAHALGMMSDQIGRETGQPPLLKIWLTAEDEKVRDSHVVAGDVYANGSGIAMDEPFHVGDSQMQYPGDPDGGAEEVCNCRCALSYEEADTTTAEPPAPEPTPEPEPAGLGSPESLAAERARYEAEDAAAEADMREFNRDQPEPDLDALPDAFGVRVTESAPTWDAARTARMFHSQAVRDEGYTIAVRSTAATPTKVRVSASIQLQTPRGVEEMGTLGRTIDTKHKVASHDSFFLNEEAQDKGIATDLLRSAIAEYDAAGLVRVEVNAAGDNGRYTWARFGFDFGLRSSVDDMRNHFRMQLDGYVRAGPDGTLEQQFPQTLAKINAAEHSWDFAALTVDENGLLLEHAGKQFMLNGPSWEGWLDLKPSSAGRKVFDAYTHSHMRYSEAHPPPPMGGASDAPHTWGAPNEDAGPGSQSAISEGNRVADALRRRIAEGDEALGVRLSSLSYYNGGGYTKMNEALRAGLKPSASFEAEQARDLATFFDTAGEHALLPDDTLLYRGVLMPPEAMQPGAVVTEQGFMSTSTSPQVARSFSGSTAPGVEPFALRVHAPMGTRYLLGEDSLSELILQPGQRYVIIGDATPNGIGAAFDGGAPIRTLDVVILKPGQEAVDLLRELRGVTPEPAAAPASVSELASRLEVEHPGLKLDVSERGNVIKLSRIVVPKEQRGEGTGSAIMERLHAYADTKGLTVALTPSTDFGGSMAGLQRFYKRHGYVANKGRNADYEISESMYRLPQGEPAALEPAAAPEPARAPSTWGQPNESTGWDQIQAQQDAQYRAQRQRGGEGSPETASRFKRGLDQYTGPRGSYKEMNGLLRTGKLAGSRDNTTIAQDQIDNMKALYEHEGEHGVLAQDTLVFRGMIGVDLVPGQVVTDEGFMSTTASAYHVGNFTTRGDASSVGLRMHAPKGTKFLTPNGLGQEQEIILQPGTRYLVVGENTTTPLSGALGEPLRTFDVIILRPGETAAQKLAELGLPHD